ncbi:OmpA family protein [Pseudomonas sp. 10B1]|uniref:OmpA family protein n=1 Tax=unclassified Pseudomonas TaxID=196821 RepID=UPI002AB4CB99|nr:MULTISPECIES: OmpA family protein [unclassified Pseudomonas]MDY7560520.1 OmpA family protein [Pseudomonas sp. AB6]MEA9975886.1 OmpA family protein [Pseudomonas sp. RTS4]MEA9993276.1 OmpA family protein [Pseudomonas sp. AA4]MEB0088147.1 OmpA family protein [Pseudomonas sp. RTI1]MEB0124237.1 OmpA family protein [Pseudomonas sp. CCC1.2]
MKLKNTLGIAIGSVVAVASFGVLAQGQGAVEGEAFYQKNYNDSVNHVEDGRTAGASIGYFLTDDVEVILGYGKTNYTRSNGDTGNQKIHGDTSSLAGMYHFGTVGDAIRPYVSGGFAHQSMTGVEADGYKGRDSSTFATIGAGAKWYITDNLYARAGVDADYKLDNGKWDYAPTIGLGVNFGGGSKPAPAPAPAPQPVAEAPVEAPMEAAPQVVRVQLDVKFDFNKAVVKPNSYADIKNLADFMKQYPQTSTTVEGHTDSVGPDAYNQKLSEKRANAVKQVLVSQYGVGAGRVSSVGYGKTRPVADNKTEAGRAINRRVEAAVEAKAAQ